MRTVKQPEKVSRRGYGSPRKGKKAAESGNNTVIDAGELAERKVYQGFIDRINAGEVLDSDELLQFARLKKGIERDEQRKTVGEIFEHQTKEAKFKAELREITAKKQRGEVISIVQHEKELVEMASQIKTALTTMPAKLAGKLANQSKAVCMQVLNEYNQWILEAFQKGEIPE